MQTTLAELARLVGGEVVGERQTVIHGVAPLEQAQPGELTFVMAPKYATRLATSRASAVLVDLSLPVDRPAIRVQDPAAGLLTLLESLFPPYHPRWHVDARAVLDAEVVLGEQVHIGPYAVIGRGTRLGHRVVIYPGTYIGERCDIGDDSVIYANASLYAQVVVGRRVIVHSGAVIGADGFGYGPLPDGSSRKIPQVGRVVIGDDVEIGANTCIDRATVGDTVIEKGGKLDNLVQVGHNTVVGAHSVLAGQVGLAGSVRVGARVRMGGQVGVADHVTIGDGAALAGRSGVASDVESGAVMFGSPAVPITLAKRMHLYSTKLGDLFRQVKQLQHRLAVLERQEKQE